MEQLFTHFIRSSTPAELTGCLSPWNMCCQTPAELAKQIQDLAGESFNGLRAWGMERFLHLIEPIDTELEAIVGWIKQASHPLLPAGDKDAVDSVIVQGDQSTRLGETVGHSFPGAGWGEIPRIPILRVLQLRQLPQFRRLRSADQSFAVGTASQLGAVQPQSASPAPTTG